MGVSNLRHYMCKKDTPLGGSPKAVNTFPRDFFLKNFFGVFTLASAVISIRAKSPATGIKGRWSRYVYC